MLQCILVIFASDVVTFVKITSGILYFDDLSVRENHSQKHK